MSDWEGRGSGVARAYSSFNSGILSHLPQQGSPVVVFVTLSVWPACTRINFKSLKVSAFFSSVPRCSLPICLRHNGPVSRR